MTHNAGLTQVGPVATVSRYSLAALVWTFFAGSVSQVFLVGLSLFESAEFWPHHENLGLLLSLPAFMIPLVALPARVGRRLTLGSVTVTLLYILQITLPNLDPGYLAALHALNAFVLIGTTAHVAVRVLSHLQRHAGGTATEVAVER